jgi:hypothetical protein
MAGKSQWTEEREDGVLTIHLARWRWFSNYISTILDFSEYIYRGQASDKWLLEPTLDRVLRHRNLHRNPYIRNQHLQVFQLATRGRRGPNPAVIEKENEWWALGQHHGLATPLLDWTISPYVAAYFAFCSHPNDGVERRVVYALQQRAVERYCTNGKTHLRGMENPIGTADGKPLPVQQSIVIFSPRADENARLVSQGGMFTRTPDGTDIESWIRKHFAGTQKGILIRITIPNADRDECLKSLNRMNINHLSLFPDLYGASRHCNTRLLIENY